MFKKNYPFFYNKKCIEFISEFEKPKTGFFKCKSSYLNGVEDIKFNTHKNEFAFDFNELLLSVPKGVSLLGKRIDNITYQYGDEKILLDKLYIDSFSTGYVSALKSYSFNKKIKKYYKLVIPLIKELNFHFKIEKVLFENDYGRISTEGTYIEIDGEKIFILIQTVPDTKEKFLVIESQKKQLFSQFADKTFAIRVSLGYITGLFPGGKGYYFSFNNKKTNKIRGFVFHTLRSDMKTLLNPINSNPHSWIRKKHIAEKWYRKKELRALSTSELSKLYVKVLEDDNFLSALLLMIESTDASLIFRPSGYSVVLETIADIIIGDKKEKLTPINSRSDSKRFRKDLVEVLDKHSSKESFKDIKTLRGRIEQINQVTNKERLRLPFKILNIELTDEDERVIKSRNDFLHGRVPDYKDLGKDRSIDYKDRDLYYASMRLYTLLNMLILKYIDYDNYVLNFAKLNEIGTTYLLNEDYYRKV